MEKIKYNISDEVLKRKTFIKGKIIDIFPDGKNSVFYVQFENEDDIQKCTENDIQNIFSKQIPILLSNFKQSIIDIFIFSYSKYVSNPKMIKISKILFLILFGFLLRGFIKK